MKGTVDQFGAVLFRSIAALSPEQKAQVRAEIEFKFREFKDRASLSMPCSERVN
jgi:hypothetical protein